MEAPPTKPVKEENMAQYVILKDSLMNELLQIEWQDEQLLADKNQQN
jgi:hypothetical protein